MAGLFHFQKASLFQQNQFKEEGMEDFFPMC